MSLITSPNVRFSGGFLQARTCIPSIAASLPYLPLYSDRNKLGVEMGNNIEGEAERQVEILSHRKCLSNNESQTSKVHSRIGPLVFLGSGHVT